LLHIELEHLKNWNLTRKGSEKLALKFIKDFLGKEKMIEHFIIDTILNLNKKVSD